MNSTASKGANPGGLRDEVMREVLSFPSMPVFISDLLHLLGNPDIDIHLVAGRIKFDPGITANLLRMANSAVFGANRSIHSIQEAIVRLGLKQVFGLVVAGRVAQHLAVMLKGYDLRAEELLEHSLWTAFASEEFCRSLNIPAPDMLFTAGLLHDLGKLATDRFVVMKRKELNSLMREQTLQFHEAERQVFGIDHAEAGARILEQWNFPAPLIAAARWHHNPDQAGEYRRIATIVHVSEFLSYAQGVGAGVDGLSYRISGEALERLGLRTRIIEYGAGQTLEKVEKLREMLSEHGGQ
jgi:putative nucleotidyltransferase with HDIG domain